MGVRKKLKLVSPKSKRKGSDNAISLTLFSLVTKLLTLFIYMHT
jgi:hypothetical protein